MCDWQDETSRLSNQLSTRSNRIGALIHSDVCGPMQVQSIGKASYYVSFHDESSEYRVLRFIKHKLEVADCFQDFFKLLHAQTGCRATLRKRCRIREQRAPDLAEETENSPRELLSSYPSAEFVLERDNHTIMEGTLTLLHSNKCLPLKLLAEAVSWVVYILNRTLPCTGTIKST
jgi:hypothetical protein